MTARLGDARIQVQRKSAQKSYPSFQVSCSFTQNLLQSLRGQISDRNFTLNHERLICNDLSVISPIPSLFRFLHLLCKLRIAAGTENTLCAAAKKKGSRPHGPGALRRGGCRPPASLSELQTYGLMFNFSSFLSSESIFALISWFSALMASLSSLIALFSSCRAAICLAWA